MTVKELAVLCKVHYNTMRKWLFDNKVEKEDSTTNSLYLITDDIILKAKKHFLNEEQTDIVKEAKINNILIVQLTQKDKQIVKQQEQIEHLQKILENQQILTLNAQEKVRLLENKEEKKSFWEKIFK